MRILSIDGGGIRGRIPAKVLAHLEEMTHKPIAHMFDIIAGTSIGGIIALGLATRKEPGSVEPRYSARDICAMLDRRGSDIFESNGWTFDGLRSSKYSSEGMERFLQETFDDGMFSDTLCKSVVVTGYEIERREPMYFSSAAARADHKDDFMTRHVARATSAAPTYFPPAHIVNACDELFYVVDGGLIANNPTQRAFLEAKRLFPYVPMNRYLIVSLGTGRSCEPIYYNQVYSMGKIGWAMRVIDITMDGASESVHMDMRDTFGPLNVDRGNGYLRIQCHLEAANDQIDDYSDRNLRGIVLDATRMLRDHTTDMKQLAALLLMGSDVCVAASLRDERLSILDEVSEPLLVVDENGIIQHVNMAFQRSLCYYDHQVTGTSVYELIAANHRQSFTEMFHAHTYGDRHCVMHSAPDVAEVDATLTKMGIYGVLHRNNGTLYMSTAVKTLEIYESHRMYIITFTLHHPHDNCVVVRSPPPPTSTRLTSTRLTSTSDPTLSLSMSTNSRHANETLDDAVDQFDG